MEIPRHWRLQAERLRLQGSACRSCGALDFPKRVRCVCGSTELEPRLFAGRGELLAVTEVVEPPRGFESQTPYLVGLVRLEEGPTVTAHLTDLDWADARVGMPVEMVTRRIRDNGPDGLILYGYKFRPRMR